MLGQRINELRRAIGWNQIELAKRLGVTKQTISNWENENIQPSIEMLLRLSSVFHVSTDYLLGKENSPHLEVSGVPVEVIAHLSQLISDFQKLNPTKE